MEEEELLTVRDVAKLLKVDTTTIRRWIADGTIEYVSLPRRKGKRQTYRIKKRTLEQILESHGTTQQEE